MLSTIKFSQCHWKYLLFSGWSRDVTQSNFSHWT